MRIRPVLPLLFAAALAGCDDAIITGEMINVMLKHCELHGGLERIRPLIPLHYSEIHCKDGSTILYGNIKNKK